MSSVGLAALPEARARRESVAAGTAAILIDKRVKAIVRTLVDEPRQPFEIERLSGVARSTLHARLSDLLALGVIDASRLSNFPRRVAYSLTDTGRLVLAGELLAERSHRRRLVAASGNGAVGLDELVGLLAPLARPARALTGRCALVERSADERDRTVCLAVQGGRLLVVPTRAPYSARVRGTSADWDAAMTAGARRGLHLVGDADFARRTIAALRAALRS
jgi:DNA-binding HxlR family transcriptional regulator